MPANAPVAPPARWHGAARWKGWRLLLLLRRRRQQHHFQPYGAALPVGRIVAAQLPCAARWKGSGGSTTGLQGERGREGEREGGRRKERKGRRKE